MDALLLTRLMPTTEGDSALEQGWLLRGALAAVAAAHQLSSHQVEREIAGGT